MNNNFKLRKVLLNLGITSNMQGYHYIIEAERILQKQKIHTNMKFLYSNIAKKYDGTVSSTERAIRYCIKKSYKKNHIFKKIYGCIPDNSVFLYDLYFNFDVLEEMIEIDK